MIANIDREKLFLAGDTSYNQDLLLQLKPDGVGPDQHQAVETHKKILQMAEQDPMVYLPSHDPQSAERLHNQMALDPSLGKLQWQ